MTVMLSNVCKAFEEHNGVPKNVLKNQHLLDLKEREQQQEHY